MKALLILLMFYSIGTCQTAVKFIMMNNHSTTIFMCDFYIEMIETNDYPVKMYDSKVDTTALLVYIEGIPMEPPFMKWDIAIGTLFKGAEIRIHDSNRSFFMDTTEKLASMETLRRADEYLIENAKAWKGVIDKRKR